MILGRVHAAVVSSAKHFKLEGRKLLVVQPLELSGRAKGAPIIAVDGPGIDSGEGDRVLVVQEGRSASMVSDREDSPIDAAIVAVVDDIELLDDFN